MRPMFAWGRYFLSNNMWKVKGDMYWHLVGNKERDDMGLI